MCVCVTTASDMVNLDLKVFIDFSQSNYIFTRVVRVVNCITTRVCNNNLYNVNYTVIAVQILQLTIKEFIYAQQNDKLIFN